ncbi:MAG: signal recognition particle protein [Myxococcota bacterium]|nr:signal recognition particle protein [Myxococcota bacterium]
MLEAVSKGFRSLKERVQGKRTLTEGNIDEALKELRVSLLEADVDFKVVRKFIREVKGKALGEVVQVKTGTGDNKQEVSPGDRFLYICQQELEALMGPEDPALDFVDGVTTIMMIGLQGAGKTTTTGKLARRLKEEGRKPLLVAADIYRPAAVDQLKVLGERLELPVYHEAGAKPPKICADALSLAKREGHDVVLFDTAGRLAIDAELMGELKEIKSQTTPTNTLLVVDAMIGQDAVQTAKRFDEEIGISGFIMTKLDGDARGGAALSIKSVTGKPIKFLGMGEGLDQLEPFRPEGLASRIMGFGDIVGLVQDFERVVDQEKAEKDAEKLLSGKFDMNDFLEQLKMLQSMGSMSELLEKMPFFGGGLPDGAKVDEKALGRIQAIIQSMTKQERLQPELIEKEQGRARRIAKGSGIGRAKEIIELVGRFKSMRRFMGALGAPGGGGLLSRIPGFKQFAQLQQLKGMDMNELMGGLGGGAPGMQGMPGMPGMGAGGDMNFTGLPKGYLLPGTRAASTNAAAAAAKKAKARNKAKQARKAKKKQRKR